MREEHAPHHSDSSFSLDRTLLRRRFERAAAADDDTELLAREIARRMDERLDYIRVAPGRVLDLGCGTGADLARLAGRFPEAMLLAADFAPAMVARAKTRPCPAARQSGLLRRLLGGGREAPPGVVADATALPLARASLGLVWSNLMLPAIDDPLPVFREIHRVLETGGLLMFSTLGPDTLRELRAALPAHAGERVHRFIDMHDLGDALIAAGFADPVMDMEMLTLTYTGFDALLHDLRASGASNAARNRPRGLSGRDGWAQARAAYDRLRRDGRLPATFEIIQGHAWKAAPKTTEDGRSIMRFQPRPAAQSPDD
ncbi:methyltransferase domain-containing protein [Thauera chlorobenzoica]|uniref:Malonyl-[acyl-carrier protein] O-methyltransferase n=1 Tax=Thauera chlorobenzoica TaxID=96773 RepID=A0A1H5TJZ2_9RHOO|nr:methyltransferase domain-containing protein [Thauera chlorobenzoica]APR06131.1 Biotin synthesis protein BioC [Thauera chlorobenzoica]SEF63083.1 malonyl-CoA O-methyltransferase [Thauera chlorobenzoica]